MYGRRVAPDIGDETLKRDGEGQAVDLGAVIDGRQVEIEIAMIVEPVGLGDVDIIGIVIALTAIVVGIGIGDGVQSDCGGMACCAHRKHDNGRGTEPLDGRR